MENNFFEEKDFSPKSTTFFIYDAFDYKDRAFKQVSFSIPAAIDKSKIKIKLVTTEGLEKEINSKKIVIPDSFGYSGIPKFRVKTINSASEDFIKEEDLVWVEQDNRKKDKIEINQFRIMGITNPDQTKNHKWKSDWVYSNIKDINNESIIYELINELMELLIQDNEIDVTLNAFLESAVTGLSLEEQLHLYLWIQQFDKYYNNIQDKENFSFLLYIKEFFVGCMIDKDLDVLLNVYLDTDKLNYKAFDEKPKMLIRKLIPEYIDLFKHVKEVLKLEKNNKKQQEKIQVNFKYKKILDDFKFNLEEKISFSEKENLKFEESNLNLKEIAKLNKKEKIFEKNKKLNLKELKKLNLKDKLINNSSLKLGLKDIKKLNILDFLSASKEKILNKEIKLTNKKDLLKSENDKINFLEKRKINKKDINTTKRIENEKQIERFTVERNQKIYNIIDKKLEEFYALQKKIKENPPVAYEKEDSSVVVGNFILGINTI